MAHAPENINEYASPVAKALAQIILNGFNHHFTVFQFHTRKARVHFEQCQWHAIREAARERIDFYDARVRETVAQLAEHPSLSTDELDERSCALWSDVKREYIQSLILHQQPELAETFYNSVFCQLYHHRYYRNELIFVRRVVSVENLDADDTVFAQYYLEKCGIRKTLERILTDLPLSIDFEDMRRDIRNIVSAIGRNIVDDRRKAKLNFHINIVRSLFFRNKAAYLVGKAVNGDDEVPFVVPILHLEGRGLVVDAILFDPNDIATVFSFAHAYFLVDAPVPGALIHFLRSVIPMRSEAELYSAIGFHKQGKTCFYRELLHHFRHSSDQFIAAPGVRGMVMEVFTLPSFPYVFKVIRDRAIPPKTTTRSVVLDRYRLVKRHDRAGRMADTLEFSNVALPRSRFSDELLERIKQSCGSQIELTDTSIVMRHVYIERRMTPLDVYINDASDDNVDTIVRDYGDAIKQLAANNIFPGDMWLKNFGVTRTQRVVFYDYDEIVYLTQCRFRHLPNIPDDLEALTLNDWFPTAANDIFPEEFAKFLGAHPRVSRRLTAYHNDLTDPDYWLSIQQRVKEGSLQELYPYRPAARFEFHSTERTS